MWKDLPVMTKCDTSHDADTPPQDITPMVLKRIILVVANLQPITDNHFLSTEI